MGATLEHRLKAAELKRTLADLESGPRKVSLEAQRVANETARVEVEKLNSLRWLLAESFVGGKADDAAYTPILDDKETRRVKNKIFEIIDRL